jgi:hypothetical protein
MTLDGVVRLTLDRQSMPQSNAGEPQRPPKTGVRPTNRIRASIEANVFCVVRAVGLEPTLGEPTRS